MELYARERKYTISSKRGAKIASFVIRRYRAKDRGIQITAKTVGEGWKMETSAAPS